MLLAGRAYPRKYNIVLHLAVASRPLYFTAQFFIRLHPDIAQCTAAHALNMEMRFQCVIKAVRPFRHADVPQYAIFGKAAQIAINRRFAHGWVIFHNAGVNLNKLEISLITRDGEKKTAILDKYNNEDVTWDSVNSAYNNDLDLDGDPTDETHAIGTIGSASAGELAAELVGHLVTYRESGSTVSLMPVGAVDVGSVEFRQFAGYDDMYTIGEASFDITHDDVVTTVWDEDSASYGTSKDRSVADDAIVFVYKSTGGDAKVISGKDLKNLTTAPDMINGAYAVGGTVNGVEYIQALAVNMASLPTVKGNNYAYVLNASETADQDDYREFNLWTENGLLTAYEESSDEYYYGGGEIVTYDVVSTGDRTIIKNVTDISATGGLDHATMTSWITSDGFYGSNNTLIAINGREYELSSDCVIVNVNTDDNAGIEGDAKAAAREAKKTGGIYSPADKNIVYVLDNDNKIVFMLIDGKNNAIKNLGDY